MHAAILLDVDGFSFHHFGNFHQYFTQCRVSVNVVGDIRGGQAVRLRQRQFRQQF